MECCICLDDFAEGKLASLTCGHEMCLSCAERVCRELGAFCPTCSHPVYRIRSDDLPPNVFLLHPHSLAIGALLREVEGRFFVAKVEEKGTADGAGMCCGDEILTVDDEPILSIGWARQKIGDAMRTSRFCKVVCRKRVRVSTDACGIVVTKGGTVLQGDGVVSKGSRVLSCDGAVGVEAVDVLRERGARVEEDGFLCSFLRRRSSRRRPSVSLLTLA